MQSFLSLNLEVSVGYFGEKNKTALQRRSAFHGNVFENPARHV